MKTFVLLSALLVTPSIITAKTEPQRIHFARGAFSKTVRGHLSKQHGEAFYLVRVRAGQKLSIKVWTANPYDIKTAVVPLLFVTSPSGQRTTDKTRRFDTLNTTAGDYQIRVDVNQMATNGEAGDFGLKVWAR